MFQLKVIQNLLKAKLQIIHYLHNRRRIYKQYTFKIPSEHIYFNVRTDLFFPKNIQSYI